MAVAKVILNGDTLMDVTADTVAADKLLSSYTATKNDGTKISGTYVAPTISTQSKTATPSTIAQSILPDTGYYLSQVNVEAIPSAYIIPSGTLSIMSNASGIDIASYASVDVDVTGGGGGIQKTLTFTSVPGDVNYSYVIYNGVTYNKDNITEGMTINVTTGEKIYLHCNQGRIDCEINVDGIQVAYSNATSIDYEYTVIDTDIEISFYAGSGNDISINYPKINITSNGTFNVSSYYYASVAVAGTAGADEILNRTITGTYSNSTITTLGLYAFASAINLTSVNLLNCSVVSSSAFLNCGNLVSAYLPACEDIGLSAFYGCTKLTDVYIPSCKTIQTMAFRNCAGLTSVDLPACTFINTSVFLGCSNIINVSLPECSNIGGSAFTGVKELTSLYLPKLINAGSSAFYGCTALSYVNLPEMKRRQVGMNAYTQLGSAAFGNCTSLRTVIMPKNDCLSNQTFTNCNLLSEISAPMLSSIGNNCFISCYALSSAIFPRVLTTNTQVFTYCSNLQSVSFAGANLGLGVFSDCSNLTTVVLGVTTQAAAGPAISQNAFCRCYRLQSLYLLASMVYNLQADNVFFSTPISDYTSYTAGNFGSIYVRESLYSIYISATNWINYASRFVSLTDAQINALNQYILDVDNETTAYARTDGLDAPLWWNGILISNTTYNITASFERASTGETASCNTTFVWNGWGTEVQLSNNVTIRFVNEQYAIIILESGIRMEAGNPYTIRISEIT